MTPYLIAFLLGCLVGGTVGIVTMGLLIATREEVHRYR